MKKLGNSVQLSNMIRNVPCFLSVLTFDTSEDKVLCVHESFSSSSIVTHGWARQKPNFALVYFPEAIYTHCILEIYMTVRCCRADD